MGSFAHSVHVKASDPDRVAASLAQIVAQDGWKPSRDQSLPQRQMPSTARGLQVSNARDGWVSVLDSDLAAADRVAPALAKTLKTHALFVFVNDSDSWSFLLADKKGITSQYDSDESEDADEGEDFGDDLVEAGPAIAQMNALLRDGSILQKMQQMQARLSAGAPADVREAEARMRSGQATAADMQRYQAWARQEMPKHMNEMKSVLAGLFNPPRAAKQTAARPKPAPQKESATGQIFDALRPLLLPGVDDQVAFHVLHKRAVFAEDVLAEFLPLVGISDVYAHLSYHYVQDTPALELEAQRIRFVHHLRFQRN